MSRLLLVIAFVLASGAAWAETQLKILQLRHRFAEDVLPTVSTLVGPGGVASAMGDKLIVRASPERMMEIERLVASLDTERRTLRITLNRTQEVRNESREIGVSGSVRRGEVTVQRPDGRGVIRRGVVVQAGQHDVASAEQSNEFLTVLEGGAAVISVGQYVPFTETWAVWTRRYTRLQTTVSFHEVATGFAVRPRVLGDEIELEVTPRVSSLSGGVIEFETLSTTVRLRPGEWLDLGGVMRTRDEVSREILIGSNASGSRQSQLRIRVD